MESGHDRKLIPESSKKSSQISIARTEDGDTASVDSNEAIPEPSCRQKTSMSSSEDLRLPDVRTTDACNGCRRQRHNASSKKVSNGHQSDGVWPEVTVDGSHGNTFSHTQEVTPGASGDVVFSPGDDMENYFNANAHMLQGYVDDNLEGEGSEYAQWHNGDTASQGLDVYETWISNDRQGPTQAADEGVEVSMMDDKYENQARPYLSQDYLGTGVGFSRCDSNDSLYNHCTDDLYQMNVTNSLEDIGDFIETDIPKNPYGCGSSDSISSRSRTPSDDDLTTLALEPSNQVTGSGDIQGALSLDWNMQFNIEHAQRPPNLMVANTRPAVVSADCNGGKPRTTSDTDYGFFTPTSCASGSSLRTRSIQSPQLSDYSATCGMNSADSSAFVSPESDKASMSLVDTGSCVRPRGDKKTASSSSSNFVCPEAGDHTTKHSVLTCSGGQIYGRPRQDGFGAPKLGEEEIDNNNFDRLSLKSAKEKLIEVKVHNRDSVANVQSEKERRRRNKGSGTCGEASSLPGLDTHSSLHAVAKHSTGANRLDCIHYGHNDLNPRNHGASDSSGRASQSSDQFNVSRQTSTSDFDQDENSFQEIVDFPPGLLENSCPSCEEDEEDEDDAAFQENPERSPTHDASATCKRQNCPDPSCGGTCKRRARSLAERRRAQQNLLQLARDDSQDSHSSGGGGESLNNLLQAIPVIQIPPPLDTNMEDIPLPPQTPILNRQWLKKAAKYLDYNFLYKSLFKDDESESDSDSEGQFEGDLRDADFDLDLVGQPGDGSRDMTHLKGRKMLYSVLLKDALLKHLQDRSNLYNSTDSDTHDVKKVMLWSEYQAYVLQVSQIGTSACGATAVINVLKYFDLYIEQEKVCEVIKTNMRAETASIGDYLISRSVAGTTAKQLVEGIHNLTDGLIYGKFFHMFPERDISIRKWLGEWMEKGAVPVVTLNRQRAIPQGWVVPDAWHHQMVYGVGPKGVYMTNPLEIVPEYVIQYQLSSESVLLVRRNDVVSRWHDDCNLGNLLQQEDVRWQEMNVLGQVVNVLREDRAPRMGTQCPQLTSHITVPAWYRSGVTLFVKRDSEAYLELVDMPEELPLKSAREESPENSPETVSSSSSSLHQLTEGGSGIVEQSQNRDSPS